MAGIDQFIQSAVGDLGITESTAKSGVGSILGAVQGKADANDFQQLLSSIPGAQGLIGQSASAATAGAEPAGGLKAGLGGVGSMLGGGGSALGLLGALTSSGLTSGQIGPFVSKFVSFAKESAGQALVGKIMGNVPELGKLLG